MKGTLHIFNETDLRIPRKKLHAVHAELLKSAADLNIIVTADARMRELNRRYRDRNTPANILTFPAGDAPAGTASMPAEIYINAPLARKEAAENGMSVTDRVIFLVIHGILHLLGYDHGDDMEKKERTYATKYIYGGKTI